MSVHYSGWHTSRRAVRFEGSMNAYWCQVQALRFHHNSFYLIRFWVTMVVRVFLMVYLSLIRCRFFSSLGRLYPCALGIPWPISSGLWFWYGFRIDMGLRLGSRMRSVSQGSSFRIESLLMNESSFSCGWVLIKTKTGSLLLRLQEMKDCCGTLVMSYLQIHVRRD